MEFSVFIIGPTAGQGTEAEVYDSILREIRLADDLGFDALWFAEHHFDNLFSTSPSPNLFLAIASQTTKTIKIGTAITVLPFHSPTRLAEEGAMLDRLSNGRFQWGIRARQAVHPVTNSARSGSTRPTPGRRSSKRTMRSWQPGRAAGWRTTANSSKSRRPKIAPRVVQAPASAGVDDRPEPQVRRMGGRARYPPCRSARTWRPSAGAQRARYEAAAARAKGVTIKRRRHRALLALIHDRRRATPRPRR